MFLHRHVLERQVGEIGEIGEVVRGRRERRLPVVLTRDEVKAVLANLSGYNWFKASLLYGSGLRLAECCNLRLQDVDVARGQILVREGKGAEDRIPMLPRSLVAPLRLHLHPVKTTHEADVRDGWGRVTLPRVLDRKYPNASREWRRQWIFPQRNRWTNERTGEQGRHHHDESILHKAFRRAVTRADLVKRATCHSRRHTFATHLLEAGYDIRTDQELLDHTDVRL